MTTEEKIIVIDTETTNSIDDPFCYDCGWSVIGLESGKTYEEHSYVVADIFLDKELMASAYFADKIPQYWEDIKNGKRKLRRFKTIRSIFRDVCAQYGIHKVCAHNASFDNRSLNYTQRLLTSSKYRYFFPYGIEVWDSLKMARETFGNDAEYLDFCQKNEYLTKNGQPRFTAEILYRFLTKCNDFVESHTGLEDVRIEKEILLHCVQNNPSIDGRLWA